MRNHLKAGLPAFFYALTFKTLYDSLNFRLCRLLQRNESGLKKHFLNTHFTSKNSPLKFM